MNIEELIKLKDDYKNYKKNKFPKLKRKRLTKKDSNDYKEENKKIKFYNEIISFKRMDYFYSQYQQQYGLKLMEKSPVKVCPYCNRIEIHNAEKHKTSQFDHFIPKGFKNFYPIFALCYYNLIPACYNCNHIKLSNDISIFSPYDKSLKNDTFKFNCQIIEMDNISVNIYSTIKEQKYIDAANGLNNSLELQELYSSSNLVKDIFFTIGDETNKIINNDYLDQLKKDYIIKKNTHNITFKKFILKYYDNELDFLSYPYSKFTKDMAEKTGLLTFIDNL